MTRDHFSMHSRQVWRDRSQDQSCDAWLRAASVAYGQHRENGHCPLYPGELARLLSTPDKRTGELLPNKNPTRAVKQAVQKGWLAPGSGTLCLIVPGGSVWMGNDLSRHKPCRACEERPLSHTR